MGFLRSSIASLGALALVAGTSAAADPVRPSNSVVSAQKAAAVTPVAQRQGAQVEDANTAKGPVMILIIITLIGGGFLLTQILSESP